VSGRDPTNGRFGPGVSGNPRGRPRKAATTDDTILKVANGKVTVTENGKRRRVTKLEAAATQVFNRGVSGDMRAGKMSLEFAQKAEEKLAGAPAAPAELSASDEEIVLRIKERFRLIIAEEGGHGPDHAG
jgi:hypothetical protein